jgi:hypothetical protein
MHCKSALFVEGHVKVRAKGMSQDELEQTKRNLSFASREPVQQRTPSPSNQGTWQQAYFTDKRTFSAVLYDKVNQRIKA